MKQTHLLPLIFLFLLLATTNGNAAGSMLRITCDGDDVGAEVLVNGKFRGECPIDLQVPEGTLKLLVRMKVDGGRERVFEQDIRMGEGSVKKVEARLGAAKVNAIEAVLQKENTRRMKAMSLAALQNEAEAGNAEAMSLLGNIFNFGTNGAPKNDVIAANWYCKAAEAGNVEGMKFHSAFLADANNPEQSAIWQSRAAETGNVEAMVDLAERYEKAQYNYPKSDVEALRWYRRAAEMGDANSMVSVGNFYYTGRSVPENNEEAVAWWRKAAGVGSRTAMFAMGRSYAKGEGVTRSEEQAINWWRKAAEGEYPNAKAVEELKRRGLR